ncbi:MAG: XrtA-associated tyrosine autokinase [Proteobacteria bacterium]|nr:XrtA-associated tyrosine autokinase [Pseudomonadota bacterium]
MSIIEKAAGKLGWARIKPGGIASQSNEMRSRPDASTATKDVDETARSEQKGDFHPASSTDQQHRSIQAVIDLARLHQAGIITPYDDKSRIAEEFRIIKRPLILDAFNHTDGQANKGNLIMVTSALAGEGKSFCAVNLAMSIAMEMDHTVLLIDADVARPAIPKYLGLKAGPGLLDVLLDEHIELTDVIMRTNVEKLSVILSGRKSKHSTELLASQSMKNLLADVAHRYHDRIIIFDSPPLLLTTESRELASQMGQIVLVVESENTPQKSVIEALRQLELCSDVKLIYNQAQSFTGKENHSYY